MAKFNIYVKYYLKSSKFCFFFLFSSIFWFLSDDEMVQIFVNHMGDYAERGASLLGLPVLPAAAE